MIIIYSALTTIALIRYQQNYYRYKYTLPYEEGVNNGFIFAPIPDSNQFQNMKTNLYMWCPHYPEHSLGYTDNDVRRPRREHIKSDTHNLHSKAQEYVADWWEHYFSFVCVQAF